MKVMPNTDADGCCPTFTQLCRGGWTLANIFVFTPIKPGVLEVYEIAGAALAAPPRNCDLYSNFDDAFEAHQRALEDYPLETHIDYDIWMFETAKGEANGRSE